MREPLSLWRGETCLLEKVREMRGLFERGIGLMGRKEMPPAWGQALYFPNTRSLHTFGMRFELDVIFLN